MSLRCPRCGESYPLSLERSFCDCGSPLLIEYERSLDGLRLKSVFELRPPGVWRYLEFLPEFEEEYVSLGEGGTFLQRAERLEKALGLRELYLKNEAMNPTGSFLDRGSTVEVTAALHHGVQLIECVSRGNLAASVAAYSVKAGIPCRVHVLPGAEQAKILQALAYDAELVYSSGGGEGGHLVRSSNPFFLEGLKTCMFEILEQFGWRPPDSVFITVGTGSNLTAAWKALSEARDVGLLRDSLPRLYGVQVSGCAPVVEAFREGSSSIKSLSGCESIFPDISEPNPILGDLVLKAIRSSGGAVVEVCEDEVLEAMKLLARNEGILAEPAASTSLAAIKKLVEDGLIDRSEKVVCMVTGSGLKDPASIRGLFKLRYPGLGKVSGTKLKILKLISRKSMHGYELWKALKEEGMELKLPTIYQHLSELALKGLIMPKPPERGFGRRMIRRYILTEAGRRALEEGSQ